MADVAMWQDKQVRAAFEAKARARLDELQGEIEGKEGIVAIEPESGDFVIGDTLCQANAAAFVRYPDTWLYFARLDNTEAAIALPTW